MKKINKQIILCSVIIANSVFAQVDYKFNGAVTKNNDAPNGYYTDNGSQYTKYNNGTSNRCNNAPNGYYTDNGNQCVASMVSVKNTQNQPQEQFFKAYNHMDLTEKSVEVKNNNKQYVASEQNNIFVKQGIVKVNDNGAVTYVNKDMLKKFLIEHGVKLSGEYATEETSTKEMINEFKEAEKDNTEIINVNYTKYNNGTSNRCNNAPNGYYTDNGNQYIMSGNNLSNNNNIPDDYYIDNNNQYVLCNRDKSILNIDDNYDINSQMDKIQKEADNILKEAENNILKSEKSTFIFKNKDDVLNNKIEKTSKYESPFNINFKEKTGNILDIYDKSQIDKYYSSTLWQRLIDFFTDSSQPSMTKVEILNNIPEIEERLSVLVKYNNNNKKINELKINADAVQNIAKAKELEYLSNFAKSKKTDNIKDLKKQISNLKYELYDRQIDEYFKLYNNNEELRLLRLDEIGKIKAQIMILEHNLKMQELYELWSRNGVYVSSMKNNNTTNDLVKFGFSGQFEGTEEEYNMIFGQKLTEINKLESDINNAIVVGNEQDKELNKTLETLQKNEEEENTNEELLVELDKELREVVETQNPSLFSSPRTMMRSAALKRTVVNDLSASQKAQNAMLSSINNNVNRVRYTNNKNLNNSIYNSIKDNIVNDGNNAGSINDSMWYSINTDMLSNRDDKTKSSSGSVLVNFGYNFDFIDNVNSSVTVSFNQTKSDLKTYSKDIPVNAYNFALSLFNKYNFGNDIVLSSMLSYNHNIIKDGNTKNIQYGYVDGDDYITSNFTKQTNKKHYNDISLSVSALYNKVILDNVKLSSGFDINYFTTNKFHNALTLSPVMELSVINGIYNNLVFPVVYVKYNTNINNKNININNGSNNKVKLDKSNAEYGVKTKINLPNKLNCVLSYSNDSNRNNNFGANVNINF